MTPRRVVGCSFISRAWVWAMVRKPAAPTDMHFTPPLKPASLCGSMQPVTMRTSASTATRLRVMGMPRAVEPRSTMASGSVATWLITWMRAGASGPSIRTISSAVLGRCRPVAMRIFTSLSGTPPRASSSRMAASISSPGIFRVMSVTMMATFLPRVAISRSLGLAMGSATARAMAARASGRTGRVRGTATSTASRSSSWKLFCRRQQVYS